MPNPDENKIKINDAIKEDLIRNAEKQRLLRDALIKEMADERAQQRFIDKQSTRADYDVKAAKHWENLDKWIKDNTGRGFEAYNEQTAAIMSYFNGLTLLCKALAYDNLGERGMKFIWAHTLEGTTAGQVLEGLAEMPGQLVDQAGDKIMRGVGARKSPVLEYSVHIDENGKLTTEVFKNGEPLPLDENISLGTTDPATGKPAIGSQKMLFDTGLVAWAQVRGWEFDAATQIIKDENGNIMTPEKFVEANKDDENGLVAFFDGKMEVEIAPSPRP